MKNLASRILNVVKQNPIELFTIVSFIVIIISKQSTFEQTAEPLYYVYTALLTIYAINALSTTKSAIYYIATLPCAAAIWIAFWCEHKFSYSFMFFVSLCALLFLMVAKSNRDNRNFVIQGGNVLKNLILASLTSGVISALILILLASLDSVFDTKLLELSSVWLFISGTYIIPPFAFLFFDKRSGDMSFEGTGNFYGVLINYILSPATLIYGVVLYMYFAKIIIAWSLPDGGIAMTSILFITIGLIAKGCREAIQKPILEPVFRNFTLLSAPAIIMMWISAWVRIAEYGMTLNRGYLVMLLIIATMWSTAMIHEKTANFRWLTTISITIILFYISLSLFIY